MELPAPVEKEKSSLWAKSRAILIGLLLVPVNIYWLTVVEVRWYSLDGSCLPLFVEPVFILLIIALLNLAVARFAPGGSLTQGELLCIYIMLVASVAIAGHDMIQNLFGLIAHPFWFASPENEWGELFFRYIPEWLTVNAHPTGSVENGRIKQDKREEGINCHTPGNSVRLRGRVVGEPGHFI